MMPLGLTPVDDLRIIPPARGRTRERHGTGRSASWTNEAPERAPLELPRNRGAAMAEGRICACHADRSWERSKLRWLVAGAGRGEA